MPKPKLDHRAPEIRAILEFAEVASIAARGADRLAVELHSDNRELIDAIGAVYDNALAVRSLIARQSA